MTPPTRYALVPATIVAWRYEYVDADGDWTPAISFEQPNSHPFFKSEIRKVEPLLAASPNGGAVTAEMLERAARARFSANRSRIGSPDIWDEMDVGEADRELNDMRAALTALGLTVADAREEAGNG